MLCIEPVVAAATIPTPVTGSLSGAAQVSAPARPVPNPNTAPHNVAAATTIQTPVTNPLSGTAQQ